MAQGDFKNQVKFGSGQPTNRGGRPKKQPFVDILESLLEGDGSIVFKSEMVTLLPNGDYRVQMPNEQMIAVKFLQKMMSGDARFFDMKHKMFGDYEAIKHNVNFDNEDRVLNWVVSKKGMLKEIENKEEE